MLASLTLQGGISKSSRMLAYLTGPICGFVFFAYLSLYPEDWGKFGGKFKEPGNFLEIAGKSPGNLLEIPRASEKHI